VNLPRDAKHVASSIIMEMLLWNRGAGSWPRAALAVLRRAKMRLAQLAHEPVPLAWPALGQRAAYPMEES
jgi:hypothetical protein